MAFPELERVDKHSLTVWGRFLHSPTMKNPGAKHTWVQQATWLPSVEMKSGGEFTVLAWNQTAQLCCSVIAFFFGQGCNLEEDECSLFLFMYLLILPRNIEMFYNK